MSNRLIGAKARESTGLGVRIVADARQQLTEYGRVLRDEDLNSLTAMAQTVEDMANGTASPKFYLSVQPTGWGKTTALVAAVRTIVNDPAQESVGVVIFVSELRQIEELISRIGLRREQFEVRTGKSNIDLNRMGRSGLCQTQKCRDKAHRRAQILFTTQQKLASLVASHLTEFDRMAFFHYCGADYPDCERSCGRIRTVRLWDEAFVPVDPVIITLEQIARFADSLLREGHVQSGRLLIDWLGRVENCLPSFETVPPWTLVLSLGDTKLEDLFNKMSSGGEEHEIVVSAMFWLAGKEVKILRQNYNDQTVSISYRRSVPHNIEPLLIYDAGGSRAMQYQFMQKNRNNVVVLPEVKKSYSNLVVNYVDEAAGQSVYTSTEGVEKLATIVAQAVAKKPVGQPVLIIHRLGRKAPASTFPAKVREKVRAIDGDTSLLKFRHYGLHVATNEFQDIKHVVLVGIYQAPLRSIIALVYGTSSKPMRAKTSQDELEMMRMSRIEGDLNQAIGRGATRKMIDGDVPEGCTVDLIGSSWGPMGFKKPLDTLREMFPGANVEEWYPRVPSTKPNAKRTAVDAALELLGDQSETVVTTGEWSEKSGYSKRTLQRIMNSDEIVRLLSARGIYVEKQGARWLLRRSG